MAVLPPLQSLVREHVTTSDGQLDPDRLLFGLNQFMGATYAALNKGLRLSENAAASVVYARFVVPEYPWTNVTDAEMSNSWVNYGGAEANAGWLAMPNGEIWLRGLIKSGTINTTAWTLPTGAHPSYTIRRAVGSNNAFGMLGITTAGAVTPVTGSNTWFDLECKFVPASPVLPPKPFSGGEWPIIVRHGLSRCTQVHVGAAELVNGDTRTETAGEFTLDWADKGDGQLLVRSVYGLQPGRTYKLTLLCLAE